MYLDRIKAIREKLAYTLEGIKRPGKGVLKYDYLVPSGYYEEQWDWDAFFMGVALSSENAAEAVYLKNWALNYINLAAEDGKVPGCVTPQGVDPRLNHMKPFLGQGIYLASSKLDDFSWISSHWETVKKIALYRENHLWSEKYDLGVWGDNMESGADNDLAVLDFPKASVIGADLNSFLYDEYKALALIAGQIGEAADHKLFSERAMTIKQQMNKHLWNEELGRYTNICIATDQPITFISYAAFIPLWSGIPSQSNAERTIKDFLLSEEQLLSKFGFRTLSKQDPRYNNANIIKPHSNWQGPVWPIVNYLYMHGILRYGFQKEAIAIANNISDLVLADIDRTGGMHENYDAETGLDLAAPNFISWNILVRNMLAEAVGSANPFEIEEL